MPLVSTKQESIKQYKQNVVIRNGIEILFRSENQIKRYFLDLETNLDEKVDADVETTCDSIKYAYLSSLFQLPP